MLNAQEYDHKALTMILEWSKDSLRFNAWSPVGAKKYFKDIYFVFWWKWTDWFDIDFV